MRIGSFGFVAESLIDESRSGEGNSSRAVPRSCIGFGFLGFSTPGRIQVGKKIMPDRCLNSGRPKHVVGRRLETHKTFSFPAGPSLKTCLSRTGIFRLQSHGTQFQGLRKKKTPAENFQLFLHQTG